jgi:hypothetical protein
VVAADHRILTAHAAVVQEAVVHPVAVRGHRAGHPVRIGLNAERCVRRAGAVCARLAPLERRKVGREIGSPSQTELLSNVLAVRVDRARTRVQHRTDALRR